MQGATQASCATELRSHAELPKTGHLIILSGPSGAGKSTVVRELIANCPLPIELSVSATTRKQRAGEVDGRDYHFVTLEKYWDTERKYVDDNYAFIPFPFKEIDTPSLSIEVNWSLQNLKGYFNTWSALQKFIAANKNNPVEDIINKIQLHWGKEEKRKIIFPIHLRLGIIK